MKKSSAHVRFFVVLGLLALAGFLLSRLPTEAAPGPGTRFDGGTMGTHYGVILAGVELSDTEYERVRMLIEAELLAVNMAMSTYIEQSEISQFNRWTSAEPFPAGESFRTVLRRAIELNKALDGAMDPTVGPLVNLWGFGEAGERDEDPGERAIASALERVGLDRLELGEEGVVKSMAELQLNLSAIAKGYGVDRVLDRLLSEGFVNVYVEIGGDLAVRGRNPRGLPWQIGIQVPEPDGPEDVELILSLERGGLASSGDYRIFRESGGGRAHHILDPRSGHPVRGPLASVTVFAEDCMTADGFATGLFVLGTEEGLRRVETRPGVEALFLERAGDGSFTRHYSSGFERLMRSEP